MMQGAIDFIRALVRPVITVGLVAGLLWLTFAKTIGPEAIVGLATLVIKYWFDDKQAEKKAEVQ